MPTSMDWGNFGRGQPANIWFESWNRAWGDMYDTWMQAVNTTWAPFFPEQNRSQGKNLHRCQDCEHDDCSCRCCVGDADLLVHARVGERRIVPLVIENDSRRERQIELELSDWTNHNGQENIEISGGLVSPGKVTLAACSEQKVILTVQISEMKDNDRTDIGDVMGCQVYYADLRVKGCDIRPIRIALAVLSRDCAPLTIECHCNCC